MLAMLSFALAEGDHGEQSICVKNSTCVDDHPEAQVCCGVATLTQLSDDPTDQEITFAYSDCINQKDSYTTTEKKGYVYKWQCIQAYQQCVKGQDCLEDGQSCGRIATETEEIWACTSSDQCGQDGTLGSLTGTIHCMGQAAALQVLLGVFLAVFALVA
mmetsp:Transcript_40310/g.29720  ORF Transcript_40310/g.29720 Transcript_40310/m.29720 type:complete len:159 (+) Transcript_40310:69-545(+)|eukprot:CAMPEP_0202970238 /NCGR_PEP_ID=MMETSP1396-20130829/16229_1 /ASSEMBLY_ACC=CAM_ASM_000872 /TAXON_ID= /ORGANISM="Pseudokeronopsis sp., Strain Brazil" /LENGTH=158 /DNA_ID=CAMNT_0049698625 /DNA_START=53 /DNA_END=529 /DNA_ORIENTATION=-